MAKRILLPYGMSIDIQRTLGYSQPTIRRAIASADDTAAARRIRRYALCNGGVEAQDRRGSTADTHGNMQLTLFNPYYDEN